MGGVQWHVQLRRRLKGVLFKITRLPLAACRLQCD